MLHKRHAKRVQVQVDMHVLDEDGVGVQQSRPNNLYVKHFGSDLDDEGMRQLFEVAASVHQCIHYGMQRVLMIALMTALSRCAHPLMCLTPDYSSPSDSEKTLKEYNILINS